METRDGVRREIRTFLILTVFLSAAAYIPLIASYRVGGTFALAALFALLWSPGIAALIARFHHHDDLYDLGWGWGETRYHLIAIMLPLAGGMVSYGLIWLTGLAQFESGFSLAFLRFFASYFVVRLVWALGGEIGWRGLLVPQLAKLTDFTRTSLISGAIWALWHLPVIIFAEGYFLGVPLLSLPGLYTLLCYFVIAMSVTFSINWLRLMSGSVWTAMLFRASHSAFILGLFSPMTRGSGVTWFLVGEYGGVLALVNLVFALYFWSQRSRLPDTRIL